MAGDYGFFWNGTLANDLFEVLWASDESNVHVEGRARKKSFAGRWAFSVVFSELGLVAERARKYRFCVRETWDAVNNALWSTKCAEGWVSHSLVP